MFKSLETFRLSKLVLCSAIITAGLFVQTVQADAVPTSQAFTLADVWDDPNDPNDDANAFVVTPSGNFQFDQFTFSAVPPGGASPNPEDIFITVMETADTVMLLFQILSNNVVLAPDVWDMQIGYSASALGDSMFTGHTLTMNATALGDAVVFLNEELRDENGGTLADLSVYDNLGNLPDQSMDTTMFNSPQNIVVADKDLVANGGTTQGNGVAFVSHFKQTFHVTPIPEPSSIALLMFGFVGLGMVSWYSRKTA